eukprot:2419561-Prymnesium_polylepis.1
MSNAMADVTTMVAELASEDQDVKVGAIVLLTNEVNDAFGDAAKVLSERLRAAGGVEVLVKLLDDPVADVQQCAMSVLGNLLTNIFEPNATESLALFDAAGGLNKLVAQLDLEYPHNLYAAACMQNVTALDPERVCEKLKELSAPDALMRLCGGEGEEADAQAPSPSPSEANDARAHARARGRPSPAAPRLPLSRASAHNRAAPHRSRARSSPLPPAPVTPR